MAIPADMNFADFGEFNEMTTKAPVLVTPSNFARAESDLTSAVMVRNGGFGKFYIKRDVSPVDHQDMARENRDTLYMAGVFDLDAGPVTIRMEFKYDGGGLAKGGDVTLFHDGKPVGKGRVDKSQPMGFSSDEACDVGHDGGSPASPDYGESGNRFTGTINWVQLDIGEDDHDHLITAEDKFRIAMARQ